jgi:hemerythrin
MTEQPTGDGYAAGIADLEAEHALQYKLLSEAERLLAVGDVGAAREVADQLYNYSEVHFGSEEVLMRLHSYPGYQAHLREHGELLTALHQLVAEIYVKRSVVGADAIRRWLTVHIHHSDQEFLEYVRSAVMSPQAP